MSRPLRAVGIILGGWTVARAVVLWPSGALVELTDVDKAHATETAPVVAMPLDDDVPLFTTKPLSPRGIKALARVQRANTIREAQLAAILSSQPTSSMTEIIPISVRSDPIPAPSSVVPSLPLQPQANRWAGSAWALMRSASAPALATGGQLAGSQAGVRIFYTPGSPALALTARVSAPLEQPLGREAAVGVALRGKNVGLIAEQRITLDKGGQDAPALFGYAGVSDIKVADGVRLDGYVQAGVVGVKKPAAFIDSAVRIETPVLTSGRSSLSVGAGAWGGAQPGVSRLDVGPQVVARVPVGKQTLRISAEWRERIAGDAAPASGPAITMGFDF